MTDQQSTITGAEIISAYKSDVEEFFQPTVGFRLEIVDGGTDLPKCIGAGDQARISLSRDIYEKPIKSYADMMLVLIVLGHETAHYLHRHNEYITEVLEERRGREMWSDHYGMKIAMVVQHSSRIKAIREKLPNCTTVNERIDGIASALGTLAVSYFFGGATRYPSTNTRVAVCIAGFNSYLTRFFTLKGEVEALMSGAGIQAIQRAHDPQAHLQRQIYVYHRVMNEPRLKALPHDELQDLSDEQNAIIYGMHRKIQADRKALFDGMNSFPAQYLRLDYSLSEEERAKRAAEGRQNFEKTYEAWSNGLAEN
ncbi:hypothetical protein [Delftia acidovorans]|uniref:hypothetical protein n=1 Tax=Delftia acidovorans TaxID=80866 RepID=UPI0028E2F744|nr:hypothetical protein [Delftia acidovorans]